MLPSLWPDYEDGKYERSVQQLAHSLRIHTLACDDRVDPGWSGFCWKPGDELRVARIAFMRYFSLSRKRTTTGLMMMQ